MDFSGKIRDHSLVLSIGGGVGPLKTGFWVRLESGRIEVPLHVSEM
mgnify:CR=1 FL=1